MAACRSLQHIFEKPLPENPTLLESLSSWKQIKSAKPIEESSFTEIFGELHFKEKPSSLSSSSSSSSSSSTPSSNNNEPGTTAKSPSSDYFSTTSNKNQYQATHKASDSFSSMNSESLQLCTESLGFESCDDVEDLKTDISNHWRSQEHSSSNNITKHTQQHHENSAPCELKRSRSSLGTFPPPISSIGKSGKPWVCFKSYRHDGRFVLKEIRVPTQEFLHARREDGRLKLQLLQSDDEILEEEEEEEDDEEEGEVNESEKEMEAG